MKNLAMEVARRKSAKSFVVEYDDKCRRLQGDCDCSSKLNCPFHEILMAQQKYAYEENSDQEEHKSKRLLLIGSIVFALVCLIAAQ